MTEPPPEVVNAIAAFVAEYHRHGGMSARLQEAVLAFFPTASADDCEAGLAEANRRDRLAWTRARAHG